ncbi:MAG: ATP-binding protein [Bdellovibrionales bacterium]|nr:ATP-binding protein [Bdellovibrionales bacterium]
MKTKVIPQFVQILQHRLAERNPRIPIVLGPRQVGKSTGIGLLMRSDTKNKYHYVLGDGISVAKWIQEQWQVAVEKGAILVIDEVQKIPDWSEVIKKLWDESQASKKKVKCVLLGSSSLYLQKGMSESLTGRFEVVRVCHWGYVESNKLKKMKIEEYLKFGGYPGSYQYLKDTQRWAEYLTSSIVETVLMKDILAQSRIQSPALFRQAFYILINSPAQVLSYNKILGQLQDRGNIDLVKYYLDLFEGAFLIKPIFNFTKNETRKRGTSPKIITYAPSLNTFHRLSNLDSEYLGRVFESAVGAILSQNFADVTYWSKGDFELDYVVVHKGIVIAIEVKSGRKKEAKSLARFILQYPKSKSVFITKENFVVFADNPEAFLESHAL